jgi:CBS domain containing-hemolysin-like protein
VWGVELTVMLAMIGITGVFAGYEIALAAVSRARLQVWCARNAAARMQRSR